MILQLNEIAWQGNPLRFTRLAVDIIAVGKMLVKH